MYPAQLLELLVMLVQGLGFQTTFPGMASQFVTSQSALQQLQENLKQEQNLFISLLGSLWRRVSQTNFAAHSAAIDSLRRCRGA